jgi:hypothetical protein
MMPSTLQKRELATKFTTIILPVIATFLIIIIIIL